MECQNVVSSVNKSTHLTTVCAILNNSSIYLLIWKW